MAAWLIDKTEYSEEVHQEARRLNPAKLVFVFLLGAYEFYGLAHVIFRLYQMSGLPYIFDFLRSLCFSG